ncbi:flagellar hook-length control protein FliK [Gilliamella sp. B2911]|uniref:flagellar hook-length control protein FliK n=1 Tax=Gilliamella sp. B2911 TaxID=2817980 RepID=UPI00226A51E2|nr:flagellar hook-length control protein FliK [Gilliamella sp. B2911]MCX8662259.1 flagellar hook-length control protein FliK [Gilliamella sp. B2911]
MNINQFSDIPLISPIELNEVSIIEDDFFQLLLQFNEKQGENNSLTKANILENKLDHQLDDQEEEDSDELFTLFTPLLTLQVDEQPIINNEHTEQPAIRELKINTTANDILLKAPVSDDINVDEKAAEILTIINSSEQVIIKPNKQTSLLTNDEHNISTNINSVKTSNQPLPTLTNIQNNNIDLPITNFDINYFEQEPTLLVHNPNQLTTSTPLIESQKTLNINLPMPMDITEWQKTLNEKISLVCRQGIQNAEIKLHPEELGSLHIKLAIVDDKMNLHMAVAHNMVKSVLESALPQLRTSLEEQGIMLEQTDISDFSMMNDSSSPYKQEFEIEQLMDDKNQTLHELDHPSNIVQSGLSIFA